MGQGHRRRGREGAGGGAARQHRSHGGGAPIPKYRVFAYAALERATDLSGTSTGAIHGDGTYFVRDAKYSNDFARTLPSGQKQMLLVDVLVGRWVKGVTGTRMLPLLPGERYVRYNLLVDTVDNPSIFVVQHSNQAYHVGTTPRCGSPPSPSPLSLCAHPSCMHW